MFCSLRVCSSTIWLGNEGERGESLFAQQCLCIKPYHSPAFFFLCLFVFLFSLILGLCCRITFRARVLHTGKGALMNRMITDKFSSNKQRKSRKYQDSLDSDGGRFGAPGGGDRFWKSCLGRSLHLHHVSALTIICHECRGKKNKNSISTNWKIWNTCFAVSSISSTFQK